MLAQKVVAKNMKSANNGFWQSAETLNCLSKTPFSKIDFFRKPFEFADSECKNVASKKRRASENGPFGDIKKVLVFDKMGPLG